MFWRNTVTTQSVCIRRSVLEAVGGYRTGVTNADWDLYLRVGARYPSIYIHRVLARYRVHPQSHGLTHLEDFVDSTLTVANSALSDPHIVGRLRNGAQRARTGALSTACLLSVLAGQRRRALSLFVSALLAYPRFLLTRRGAQCVAALIIGPRLYAAARLRRRASPFSRFFG